MPRALVLALTLSVLSCGSGEDTEGSGSTPGTSVTAATGSSGSSGDASTSGSTGTSAEPTTAEPTTAEPTTAEPTTGDASTGDTTGPACDPGTDGCPCDAGMCDAGLMCDADVCVPALACDGDVTEPDDDEASAHSLGEITDDDSEKVSADGVLSGTDDADWYYYKGIDTFGHVSEPTIQVSSSASVRVCQFLECEEGAVMTTVECPADTQSALSPTLRPGCCGGPMFTVSSFECPGTNDNLFVYVRIDKAAKDSCVEYSLTAHD